MSLLVVQIVRYKATRVRYGSDTSYTYFVTLGKAETYKETNTSYTYRTVNTREIRVYG